MAKHTPLQERLDPHRVSPELTKLLIELSAKVALCGLESTLMDLIKLRASQINGCAYCLHMHAGHARASGESEMRLHLLPAWRESPLFNSRERAALAWTEALTLLPQTMVPDAVYSEVEEYFSEKERVALTMVIVTINSWNRLAVGFRRIHPLEDAHAAA